MGGRRGQYAVEPQREAEVQRIYELVQQDEREFRNDRTSLRRFYPAREEHLGTARKTALCRDWFGDFVPIVRFPSLAEVSEQLYSELQEAQFELAATDRTAFSDVFVKVIQSVMMGPAIPDDLEVGSIEPLLDRIRESLAGLQAASGTVPTVYNAISSLVMEHPNQPTTPRDAIATRILRVYDEALRERIDAQRRAFSRIKTFEESVNRFLAHKRLVVSGSDEVQRGRSARAKIVVLDGGRSASLSVLSSGERHVLTLLFSATHMSATEGMLLIDEPELSLHVDWQRVILSELIKQAGERQIIACTHAPEVTADHRDAMTRLGTRYMSQASLFDEDSNDVEP